MNLEYEEIIDKCHFAIKCQPHDTKRQRVEHLDVSICPDCKWQQGSDSFHNLKIYGDIHVPHDSFEYMVTGSVITGLKEYDDVEDRNTLGMYRYSHGLNKSGEKIRAYYESMDELKDMSDYDKACYVMHRLNKDFTYAKDSTGIYTTAEEAFVLGKGVCQDYAHIMIAVMQLAKIPARYVAGMMLGEGYSHGWTQVLCDGRWYSFDPTNDKVVNDEYIVIGVGRDASDCQVNRGLIFGGGRQRQTIKVEVWKG